MKCNVCNSFLDEDALFCPDCGERVIKIKEDNEFVHCTICEQECDHNSDLCKAYKENPDKEDAEKDSKTALEVMDTDDSAIVCLNCENICKINDRFCSACGYDFLSVNMSSKVRKDNFIKKIKTSKVLVALKKDFANSETLEVIQGGIKKPKFSFNKKFLFVILILIVAISLLKFLADNIVTCDYCDGLFWHDDVYNIWGKYVCDECFM